MNKIFSLSIFTIAFAMAFLLAAPIVTMAVSDNYNVTPDSANLFGIDESRNGIVGLADRDRDMAPDLIFQTYGLQGNWEPGNQ